MRKRTRASGNRPEASSRSIMQAPWETREGSHDSAPRAGRSGPPWLSLTALGYMAVGLVAYASTKVFVPYFYAMGRPRIPLVASLLAVTANLVTLRLLFGTVGFLAGGLGMAMGNLANGGFLLLMYRGPEPLLRRVDLRFLASIVAASLGMAGVVLAAVAWIGPAGAGWGGKSLGALVPVTLGAAIYFALTVAFGVPEARHMLGALRRRLAR